MPTLPQHFRSIPFDPKLVCQGHGAGSEDVQQEEGNPSHPQEHAPGVWKNQLEQTALPENNITCQGTYVHLKGYKYVCM